MLADSARRDAAATSMVYCPQRARRAAESSEDARGVPGIPEDSGWQNYYVGECGHRIPEESGIDGLFRIGPCCECDEEPPREIPASHMAVREHGTMRGGTQGRKGKKWPLSSRSD